jgi:putative FmdB family regulatory protein
MVLRRRGPPPSPCREPDAPQPGPDDNEDEYDMPIYEYQCGDCGHYLDALQKISDDPLKHCPDCGEPSLKRLVSAPRFRLKGSGWYETDFKDKNRRNIAGEDGKTDKKAEKSGDGDKGKGDSKPESAKPATESKSKTTSTDKKAE